MDGRRGVTLTLSEVKLLTEACLRHCVSGPYSLTIHLQSGDTLRIMSGKADIEEESIGIFSLIIE